MLYVRIAHHSLEEIFNGSRPFTSVRIIDLHHTRVKKAAFNLLAKEWSLDIRLELSFIHVWIKVGGQWIGKIWVVQKKQETLNDVIQSKIRLPLLEKTEADVCVIFCWVNVRMIDVVQAFDFRNIPRIWKTQFDLETNDARQPGWSRTMLINDY